MVKVVVVVVVLLLLLLLLLLLVLLLSLLSLLLLESGAHNLHDRRMLFITVPVLVAVAVLV